MIDREYGQQDCKNWDVLEAGTDGCDVPCRWADNKESDRLTDKGGWAWSGLSLVLVAAGL